MNAADGAGAAVAGFVVVIVAGGISGLESGSTTVTGAAVAVAGSATDRVVDVAPAARFLARYPAAPPCSWAVACISAFDIAATGEAAIAGATDAVVVVDATVVSVSAAWGTFWIISVATGGGKTGFEAIRAAVVFDSTRGAPEVAPGDTAEPESTAV